MMGWICQTILPDCPIPPLHQNLEKSKGALSAGPWTALSCRAGLDQADVVGDGSAAVSGSSLLQGGGSWLEPPVVPGLYYFYLTGGATDSLPSFSPADYVSSRM